MESSPNQSQPVRAQLGLWDAVSIIIGIVIGAGIYETPPLVFRNVSGPWIGLAVWAIAGLLCLVGALCYAELASAYPRLGGDYVYLTRAYGSRVGFLYGWTQLAVIQTGSIGMMAYVFGDYARKLLNLGKASSFIAAVCAVALLSALNLFGVVFGKPIQNLLTAAKVLGLGGILIAGLVWGHASLSQGTAPAAESGSIAFALVLVFLTFGGWNDAAFVAAELRDRRRNIPTALILGTASVTFIYLLVNAAYLWGLGFEGVRKSDAVAADVLKLPLEDLSSNAMCLLVMISALGAINGLIYTSSRIYSTLGSEHSIFARLGHWNSRFGSPVWSLVTQAVISLVMIAAVGSETGQHILTRIFALFGLSSSWEGRSGFETLLKCTAPIFWLFFLLSGVSLFVLRIKDPQIERPFKVPLFPVIPAVFCATCVYMLYAGINYAWEFGLVGAALVLAGVPLYAISKPLRPQSHEVNSPDS
jgi:amino acid transporter